jgi:thimet oligopeptidase
MPAMLYDYRTVTVETVRSEIDAALTAADVLVEGAIAAAPSYEGTLRPLDLAGAELVRAYGRAAFMGQVHNDPAVRDAGMAAEERINKWRVGLPFRRDLYEAVRRFAETDEATGLAGEQARLLEHWLRDFRRAGHELGDDDRAELERLRNRLVEVEIAFQRNVNEHKDGIDVTRDELAGLPDSYVDRLGPGERPGTYRVTLDYPQVNPFLEQAHHRDLRRTLFEKNWSRARALNVPLLDEALALRRRIAALLGQPTWAHYAMELKMAREPSRVERFYEELRPALRAAIHDELDRLESRMVAAGGEAPLQVWDWKYEDTGLRRDEYGVDQDLISQYLPLDAVMDGMFALTGEVFGLDYRAVEPVNAWDEAVTLYEILDRATGEHIAHFYADLHPREGTFGHAAAFPLVIGHVAADGSRVAPISAIVANITPPGDDQPALLRHSEVTTLFHEFGHILHMSLTRTETARFSGAETEWDFVEAPSQIMEHWAWAPSVLGRFARHWRTGEAMPLELMESLSRSRWVDIGLWTGIQAFYGLVDMAIHADPTQPDPDRATRETFDVTGMPYPENTSFLSGFAHLVGGYDAGYYGYLWASVIGDDMFSRFAREGLLSPTVGADYRREILEPNGSRDADELVRRFLGREFSNEEFLRLRGMGAVPAGGES